MSDGVLGARGHAFPKDPGSLMLTAVVCGKAARLQAWWGLAVMSARCPLASCLGFALRRSGRDGSFWAPRDTCPLDVSWGGSVDPCKRTNVNVTVRSPTLLIFPQIVTEIYCLLFY